MFALPFKNVHHDSIGDSFADYFMPLVELKDFKVLMSNKILFDKPVKKKQEAYENLLKFQETIIIQQETY